MLVPVKSSRVDVRHRDRTSGRGLRDRSEAASCNSHTLLFTREKPVITFEMHINSKCDDARRRQRVEKVHRPLL